MKLNSMPVADDPRTPRCAPGSVGRIVHALGLGFLQPVVPLCIFVGLASLLFDTSGNLKPPGLLALIATLLVPLLPNAMLVGLALVKFGRTSLRDLGWFMPSRPLLELAKGLVGLAVYLAVYAGAVVGLGHDAHSTFATALAYPLSSRLLLLMVGAHIAFFEESVFRGYLQPALMKRFGYLGGLLLTAVLFAAWHPPYFHVVGFVIRLGLGLVTGVLRGTDRSLMAPAVAHALLWAVVGLA